MLKLVNWPLASIMIVMFSIAMMLDIVSKFPDLDLQEIFAARALFFAGLILLFYSLITVFSTRIAKLVAL